MRFTRRRFLAASAAMLPSRAWSATELDLGGGRTLVTLSDGHLELPPDFVFGLLPPDEAAAIRSAHGLTEGPLIAPCNVTLFRDGSNLVLFDAGAGQDFMATAGRLPEALDALGVAPGDVTHLIFTHGHPDHLWGVLDDFGDLAFPKAQIFMGGTEFAYWTDPATIGSIDPGRQGFAVGAARRLAEIGDLVTLIDEGDSPIPGVIARLTPGHTPGHVAYELDATLLVGDAIGNGHVAFDLPGALTASDQDPDLAADTRMRLFADLSGTGRGVIGFHLPDGGIGVIEAAGAGYRFDAG
ncbi:MAG: MBL fold metallo-hydrolase [Rhodobacteraceae bacterium]|nr:MBL fold metallo-hydrolase [Paracoccaceae bacterium]